MVLGAILSFARLVIPVIAIILSGLCTCIAVGAGRIFVLRRISSKSVPPPATLHRSFSSSSGSGSTSSNGLFRSGAGDFRSREALTVRVAFGLFAWIVAEAGSAVYGGTDALFSHQQYILIQDSDAAAMSGLHASLCIGACNDTVPSASGPGSFLPSLLATNGMWEAGQLARYSACRALGCKPQSAYVARIVAGPRNTTGMLDVLDEIGTEASFRGEAAQHQANEHNADSAKDIAALGNPPPQTIGSSPKQRELHSSPRDSAPGTDNAPKGAAANTQSAAPDASMRISDENPGLLHKSNATPSLVDGISVTPHANHSSNATAATETVPTSLNDSASSLGK